MSRPGGEASDVMTQRLARVAGAATVLVGLVHLGVGFTSADGFGFGELWFAGSGVAVILIGALTLLCSSPRAWPALGSAALLGNAAGLLLGIAFGVLSRWQEPQGPVLAVLFALGALGGAGAIWRRP